MRSIFRIKEFFFAPGRLGTSGAVIVLMASCLSTPHAQQAWTVVSEMPGTSISCPTANTCYTTIKNSTSVNKTTDGGVTWSTYAVGSSVAAVGCPDSLTCYAVGTTGIVGRIQGTRNGGLTWSTVYQDGDAGHLYAIFASPGYSFAVGSNSHIAENNGGGWSLKYIGTTSDPLTYGAVLRAVSGTPNSPTNAIAVGTRTFSRSSGTWDLSSTNGGNLGVARNAAGTIVTIGDSGRFTAGSTTNRLPTRGTLNAIVYPSPSSNTAYVSSDTGIWKTTTASGNTSSWTLQIAEPVQSFSCADSLNCFGVNYGKLLRLVSAPTNLSYSLVQGVKGMPLDSARPTVKGAALRYSVSPALPAGLRLDSLTGVISGTPPGLSSTTHTGTAKNAAGSTTYSVQVVIRDIPPVVDYTSPSGIYTAGIVIDTIYPASTGGAIVSFTITPSLALKTGLKFDSTTGRITGTPKLASASTSYAIIASNSGGADTAFLTVTVRGVLPGAPTAVSGSPDSSRVVVSWTAPAFNGGTAIKGYAVTVAPGGSGCSWTTGPLSCTVNGLTNGSPYTFTVTASNDSGTSAPSAPSGAVTPRSVPEAPSNPVATAASGSAQVTWAAPAQNGGSAIVEYVVTAQPDGATCSWTSGSLTCNVTGLTNGTSYAFTVKARNSAGFGPASISSAPVVPQGAPYPPENIGGTAGNAQVAVTWAPPALNGGSTITGYKVVASPGGASCDWVPGNPLGCTVSGLTNGTSYTFLVTASNALGSSSAGVSSASFTPRTVPGSPTQVKATPAAGTLTVSWTAPTSNGGAAITGYTVNLSVQPANTPSGSCSTSGALTCSVSGLLSGTRYAITVAASNAAGTGAASASIEAQTPTALLASEPKLHVSHTNPYVFHLQGLTAFPKATLSLSDASGRVIWSQSVRPGKDENLEVTWDGLTTSGRIVPTGTYIARISVDKGGASRKVAQENLVILSR